VYSDRDHLDRLAAGLRDVVRIFGGASGPHAVGEVPAADRTPASAVRMAVPAAPTSAGGRS
jgi:hypothetical protein